MIANLAQLQRELVAAGIVVTALGQTLEGQVYAYDASGAPTALPPGAASVIAAHVDVDDEALIRSVVIPLAQTAVGVALLALTPNQQRALLACLLYKVGALDPTGKVLPLANWLT